MVSPLLDALVREIWARYSTLDLDEAAFDEVIAEFERFIDTDQVRLRYLAPIVNLHVAPGISEIELCPTVSIRRLTSAEMTALYGYERDGAMFTRAPISLSAPQFAFVGEFEEPKFSEVAQAPEQVRQDLRLAVLALRSFKPWAVGHLAVQISPVGFYPAVGPMIWGDGSEYIPLDSYDLTADEIGQLQRHAAYVFAGLHRSFEIPLSRLASAAIKVQHTDKLLDASIGLEAILLHGISSEVTYRFALNYASLAARPSDRAARFRTAKEVYKRRCEIVHGEGTSNNAVDQQQADAAVEMLRELLAFFLPEGPNPGFAKEGYWEHVVLSGLPHT
jgi:hypothetical protein